MPLRKYPKKEAYPMLVGNRYDVPNLLKNQMPRFEVIVSPSGEIHSSRSSSASFILHCLF